jgi:hypothetical protein
VNVLGWFGTARLTNFKITKDSIYFLIRLNIKNKGLNRIEPPKYPKSQPSSTTLDGSSCKRAFSRAIAPLLVQIHL